MKDYLRHIDKAFENRVRLGIMSSLMVNEELDFKSLKNLLDVTDGNLASHIKALEYSGYIQVYKHFIGKKPNTQYIITETGKAAFEKHIDNLNKLINP